MLGVVGGLNANLFLWLLRVANWLFLKRAAGCQPPSVAADGGNLTEVIGPRGLWLIPVVTTLGGLISGVYSLAPETEGHGTNTAVRASLVGTLEAAFHSRVQYPWQEEEPYREKLSAVDKT